MQTSFLEHHFCKSNDKTVVIYGGSKVNKNWRVRHVLYTYILQPVCSNEVACAYKLEQPICRSEMKEQHTVRSNPSFWMAFYCEHIAAAIRMEEYFFNWISSAIQVDDYMYAFETDVKCQANGF